MGRERLMTIGLLLVLVGVQLYCVRTYVVSPKVAKFVKDRIEEIDAETDSAAIGKNATTYFPANFSNNAVVQNASDAMTESARSFTPPSWLKWASFFAGAVIFLQGATLPKGH